MPTQLETNSQVNANIHSLLNTVSTKSTLENFSIWHHRTKGYHVKYIQIDFSTDNLFERADCNMHEFHDSEVQAVYLMVNALCI